MGKLLNGISTEDAAFIAKQRLYFVATAPSSNEHHINMSPRSDGFQIVNENVVAICDLSGSAAETAAHLLQNGRITIMFTNMEKGPPKILRLYGFNTQILLPSECDQKLLDGFPSEMTASPGFRAVYYVHIHRVTQSCGYSIPIMKFEKNRTNLYDSLNMRGKEKMPKYHIFKNAFSIDGLPGLAHLYNKETDIRPQLEGGYIFGHYDGETDDDDTDDSDDENENKKTMKKEQDHLTIIKKTNQFHEQLNSSNARTMGLGKPLPFVNTSVLKVEETKEKEKASSSMEKETTNSSSSLIPTSSKSTEINMYNNIFNIPNVLSFSCGLLFCQVINTAMRHRFKN
eukprot:CAMPEP_0114395632 /NCGR_PEP_ID=MMETSP0102-20121206/13027_1 /TAXON_ID=38822 ORGANISM="Pteridomonas danica, Strain PT" /NCGR_SAMPLE_ID=MMETSP0102 /ASSEMBLY_ACC=CAM_ASM_000212 /LENGTH=341 /DNA_ID=CAMNT_0001556075 /DNA_START=137 /DNA_END=1162 /DNA_ORIENTATION=+